MINNYLESQIKENFRYEPTLEQNLALQAAAKFLVSPQSDTLFLLRGFAGTGKTSLVSALVQTLDALKQKCVLLAPTGRAAKVFSLYANHPAYTIHKKIYRQRSFSNETDNFSLAENLQKHTLFLVDEAHNLVERAREMYSAALFKENFLKVRTLVKPYSPKLERKLSRCNRLLLEMKRDSDGPVVRESIGNFVLALTGVFSEMEKFKEDYRVMDDNEDFGALYLDIRHFLNMYDRLDSSYCVYTEPIGRESFMLKLLCANPAENLSSCLRKGNSTVFFSATLLPVLYYKELLCGSTEEYAVYAPSPFDQSKRLLAVGRDVSNRYKRRNSREYGRILDYILAAAAGKKGNYLVYFPSYSYMDEVYQAAVKRELSDGPEFLLQSARMSEADREEFLSEFGRERDRSLVAFCVMGGVFSEGIDLQGEKLIGVLVVGTGLPQICTEREILRGWYEEQGKDGFAYAYRYPGMNRVLQAAGRVIRTDTDEGVILLLDDRFLYSEYQRLFPREWADYHVTNYENIPGILDDFWINRRK